MKPLYPIIDLDTLTRLGLDPIRFASRVLTARPRLLQLRAKHQSAREALAWLDRLLPLCRGAGTQLYANDRPDLAVLSGADGVHVGQADLPVSAVRRFNSSLRVGVSTHNLSELRAALVERPDYVALGPIFETRSKLNPEPVVGWEALEEACTLCSDSGVRLVAIGGIEASHLPRLAELPVTVAMISAFLPPNPHADDWDEQVERRAQALAAVSKEDVD